MPAAIGDAGHRRMRGDHVKAIVEKFLPVVGRDLIERGDEFFKRVRNELRRAGWRAVKQPAEIVERLLAVRELTNGDVGFEPHEPALVVKIDPTAPRSPGLSRNHIEKLSGDGGIFERAPGAAGPVVEIRGGP